jgi:D-hexose-6-phosphate mutarotase
LSRKQASISAEKPLHSYFRVGDAQKHVPIAQAEVTEARRESDMLQR